jgi:hypothetical protein
MEKRTVTRIGNVFCVEIGNKYKCYFQYIACDKTQLNSPVIRVFKEHYPIGSSPAIEEILKGEVHFYAHTVIQWGTRNGLWYKVGTSKNIGNIEDIRFRLYGSKWYWWTIGNPSQYIEQMTDETWKYDLGYVFANKNIIYKIENGILEREIEEFEKMGRKR